MDGKKREVVIHVFDNQILVRRRMESFIHDREVACGNLHPHDPLWELFNGQKEKMTRTMANWDKIRVRGDKGFYRYQVKFVDEFVRALGPEVRPADEDEDM